MPADHFKGKTPPEHLKVARLKGALASTEIHGVEISSCLSAGIEAARQILIALLFLWILLPNQWIVIGIFSLSFLVWRGCHTAFLGWARLEKLHRVTEEERWEVEHNRDQEREELTALYQAKGLSGKLLEDVITVFMANENRLLRIMLEEELGLNLEIYDHPIQQGLSAALGVFLCSSLFILIGFLFPLGSLIIALIGIMLSSIISAKILKNKIIDTFVWNLAIAGLASGICYFLKSVFDL